MTRVTPNDLAQTVRSSHTCIGCGGIATRHCGPFFLCDSDDCRKVWKCAVCDEDGFAVPPGKEDPRCPRCQVGCLKPRVIGEGPIEDLPDAEALRAASEALTALSAESMREACALVCQRRAEELDAASGDDPNMEDPDVIENSGRFLEANELAAKIRALPVSP